MTSKEKAIKTIRSNLGSCLVRDPYIHQWLNCIRHDKELIDIEVDEYLIDKLFELVKIMHTRQMDLEKYCGELLDRQSMFHVLQK